MNDVAQICLAQHLRNRRRSLVTVSIAALGTAAILLAGGFALFTYEAWPRPPRAPPAT
jgi:hypothetical protein